MKRLAKKAINFDLNTKKMGEYFSNYTQGYRELEKSFMKQQFQHDQGSGYISQKPLSVPQVFGVLNNIVQENPWLPDCARRFRITEPTVLYEGELLLNKIGSHLSERSSAAATVVPQAVPVASSALQAMRAGFKAPSRKNVTERQETNVLE